MDSQEIKSKLVEQILTAGSVAGIVTAFLHPSALPEALFVTAIILFVFSSVNVYAKLLTEPKSPSDKSYKFSVAVMLVSFIALLLGLEFDALFALEPPKSDLFSILNYVLVIPQFAYFIFSSVFARVYNTLTDRQDRRDKLVFRLRRSKSNPPSS